MTRLSFVLVALSFLLPAAAPAQPCRPDSAELAYEELLEATEDGSPADEETRRVGDEQEQRGEFESARTIDLLEEVAARWGLYFDCASRTYRPVGAPPLAPGEEEFDEDEDDEHEDDGDEDDGGAGGGSGGEGTPAAGQGGAPRSGGSPTGSGPAPGAGGEGGPEDGTLTAPSPGATGTSGTDPGRAATVEGASDGPRGHGTAETGASAEGPGRSAPDAPGGSAIAVLTGEDRLPWPLVGAGLALAAGGGGLIRARRRSRRGP